MILQYIEKLKLALNSFAPKRCQHCGSRCKVSTDHNGFAYENNEQNYSTLCSSCWPKMHEYVRDMWRDYYSGVL